MGQCCQSLLAAEFCSDCTCVCCSTGYVLCQLQTNSSQIANFKNGCMTRVCHEKGRNVHYGTAGEPWSVRTSTQTATRLSRPPAKTDFPPLHSVRNAHASQPIRDPIDSRHTGPMFFFKTVYILKMNSNRMPFQHWWGQETTCLSARSA